jgi:hypothetical protein
VGPAKAPSEDFLSFDVPASVSRASNGKLARKPKTSEVNLMASAPLTLPRRIPLDASKGEKDLFSSPNLLRRSKELAEPQPSQGQQTRSNRAAWHKHQGEGALTMRQRLSQQKTAGRVPQQKTSLAPSSADDDDFGDFVEPSAPEPEIDLLDMHANTPVKLTEDSFIKLSTLKMQQEPDLLQFGQLGQIASTALQPSANRAHEQFDDDIGEGEDEDEDEDEDEEFGEMVSPDPDQGSFDAVPSSRPSTAFMLNYLLQHVLIVPEAFLKALAPLSYPMRQKVLHHEKTKAWVEAMREAGILCQRLLRGRRLCIRSKMEEATETVLAQQVVSRWASLLPRLKSLSAGSGTNLTLIEDVAEISKPDSRAQCSVCLQKTAALEEHTSCLRLRDRALAHGS